MKYKYTIGEVQKQTGIAASALRFYDDIGLVKPSYTDENTGYRYYSYKEFWQLEIVKICKSVGIPLKTLKNVLSTNDPEQFVKLMIRQRESARKKLDAMQKLVDELDWMTERFESVGAYEPETFTLKWIGERKVIAVDALPDMDSDSLHFALQVEIEELMNRRGSIQREYGYQLGCEDFRKGKIRWEKEFLIVDEEEAQGQWTETMPAGDYISFLCKPFSEECDVEDLVGKALAAYPGTRIRSVYALEAALFFYDWQDEVYEIQLLVEHEK